MSYTHTLTLQDPSPLSINLKDQGLGNMLSLRMSLGSTTLLSGARPTLTNILFSANEPGFTFEPWDITTLYQDRAGTTPVTAAGQSVGLRLSKDQGLRQGPELVTNGTFDTGITGWTNLTPTGSSFSWNGGGWMDLVFTTGLPTISTSFPTTIGKSYVVTASKLGTPSVINIGSSAGGVNLFNQANSSSDLRAFFTATTTTTHLSVARISSGTSSIDNISVRELAGNHEVAVSDAKRGVYGWMPKTGRRNLLTYTEQFDNAAWVKGTGGSISSNSAIAPDGTMTAHTYTWATSSPSFAYLSQQAVGVSQNPNVYSVWLKRPSGTGSRTVKLAVTDLVVSTATSGTFTVTEVWQRFEFTRTSASTTGFVGAGLFAGTSGSPIAAGELLEVWHPQLEPGSTATAYQRVTSQYDITEAGVPTCYYVQADGVDDAYVTPTIIPNTDKAQVFAGVRKLSDAAASLFIEHSANVNSNNGAFEIGPGTFSTATGPNYHATSKGTLLSGLDTPASYTSPVTNVVSALMDISGDRNTIRVNGTQVAQSTTNQGTGNFLAYPAYMYSRGGISAPFNGLDFGHAVRFGPNLDAATIARVESLIARNTPEVTL